MGHFNITVNAGAPGMDDAFGNSFTIEIGKLLKNMKFCIRNDRMAH